MKYIDISYKSCIQETDGKIIPEGCAVWPDNLDDSIFYEYKGFVTLKFEEVDGVFSVVSCEPDIDSFNKWSEEHNNDHIFDPMREKNQMLAAVSFAKMMLPQTQLSTDDTITVRALYDYWELGDHKEGEIYLTGQDTPWKCRQNYNNETFPDIVPGSETWYTFNIPLHGTTPETALPWVEPREAESQYKNGEYMIWTDGKIYKCKSNTNFSPEEYSEAWELINVTN